MLPVVPCVTLVLVVVRGCCLIDLVEIDLLMRGDFRRFDLGVVRFRPSHLPYVGREGSFFPSWKEHRNAFAGRDPDPRMPPDRLVQRWKCVAVSQKSDGLLLSLEETALLLGIGRSTSTGPYGTARCPSQSTGSAGCSYVPKAALQRFLAGETGHPWTRNGNPHRSAVYASWVVVQERPDVRAARWSSLAMESV